MGADFIEPDLVSTKDHVLIARHENELSGTTDVADHPEFASRKAIKKIDGREVTGWFTEDFTLAEIKTLRARERLPFRDQSSNGQFEVPTFAEVIALAKRKSTETGRTIGVYPETKHPTYFRSIGLPLEEPLLADLKETGYRGRTAAVYIQSFEVGNLKRLREVTDLPLIQLMEAAGRPWDFAAAGDPRTYHDLATSAGLAEIAVYADGIGPDKRRIVPAGPDGRLLPPTSLVADAHGLSRGMTYKSLMAGLPLGGGKSVILRDADSEAAGREAVFRAHGRAVERLGGLYITAEDVGTSPADMEIIRQETRHVAGLLDDPSPDTARGVLRALAAAACHRWGTDDLAGRTVAIQGCGNVGFHL